MAVKWTVKTILGLVMLGLCLFGVAGRLDWPAAWGLMAIAAANQVLVYALVSRVHLDLLEERGRIRPGTKKWDRTLAPLMAYSGMFICIACALDRRFGWTESFPGWLQWVALLPILAGLTLGQWAVVTNRFFSATVRIQTERGHRVVEDGPYRYVRHPGYISAILYNLATPLLLSSWWGLVPGVLAVGVALIRTQLEDRTLQAELPGYAGYAQRVKYRFIPGIW